MGFPESVGWFSVHHIAIRVVFLGSTASWNWDIQYMNNCAKILQYMNICIYVPSQSFVFWEGFQVFERKERRCLWSLFLSAWKMVYVTMLTWIQSFNALIFLFVSIKNGGWNWLEHLVFKCKEGRQVGKHVFDLWFCQDEEWWMKLTWTNQVWKWKGEWNGQHMTTPPW